MLAIGKKQTMMISRKVSIGAYLTPLDEPEHDGILLPSKYLPKDLDLGDKIDVFVYKDSEDRDIAVTIFPKLCAYEIGYLKVVSVTDFGAFLDWGLEKDLFLPSSDQTEELLPGDDCLVYIDVDFKEKLYASMKIQRFLTQPEDLQVNDQVECIVYKIVKGIGAFVAIYGKYIALIPEKEIFEDLEIAKTYSARVSMIKPDGKVDLSLRAPSYLERDEDANKIYALLLENDGFLAVNDKTSPEKIKSLFHISKASFKKAVGKLLKEKKIIFEGNGIRLQTK